MAKKRIGGPSGKPAAANDQQEPQMPTPEQLKEMLRMDIGFQLAGLVERFAPNFDKEKLPSLIEFMVEEQMEISEVVMPTLMDPSQVEDAPMIVVELGSADDAAVEVFQMAAPKRISDAKTTHNALGSAMLLGLLLQAPVRGLLRVFGYHYTFKALKAPSRIITPN